MNQDSIQTQPLSSGILSLDKIPEDTTSYKKSGRAKIREEVKDMCRSTTYECKICYKRKDINEFDIIISKNLYTYIYVNRCKECRKKYRRRLYNKKRNGQDEVDKKCCSICQETLPIDDFPIDRTSCKQCHKEKKYL